MHLNIVPWGLLQGTGIEETQVDVLNALVGVPLLRALDSIEYEDMSIVHLTQRSVASRLIQGLQRHPLVRANIEKFHCSGVFVLLR